MKRKKTGPEWIDETTYALESENRHAFTHVPEALYKRLIKLIPEDKHDELGKIIYDCLAGI